MKSVDVKLRRLLRGKRRARTGDKFDKWSRLYWRYHLRLYGSPSQWRWPGDE